MGVHSIALLLDFFSVKEAAKGFLYLSKRSRAPLIISDLSFSHKYWKDITFLSATVIGSIILLTRRTLWEFRLSGPLPRIYVSSSLFWFGLVFKLLGVSNFALIVRSSGIFYDLSPEDREVSRSWPSVFRVLIPSSSGRKFQGLQVRGLPDLLL